MRFLFVALIIIIINTKVEAQIDFDSSAFDNAFVFNNGIYASFEELKYNSPSYPECELELEKNKTDLSTDKLYYINSRQTRLKFESNLFATVVDGHLSIFYDNQLNAVFLKGAISTFILQEVVTTTHYQQPNNMGYGYPGYGGPSVPVTTSHVETNIYFLDFKTGMIAKVEKENLEPIIMRDPTLYESFKKIKGDANNRKSYPFISQYNTRNPVYIRILPIPDTENE